MKARIALLAGLVLTACDRGAEPPAGGADPVAATAAEHAHDAPTPTPLTEAEPAVPVLEQELAYGEANRRNLVGYLAMPADAAEPLPGLLVVHEWWGLNDNIKALTRQLAGEGYVVLAVDLYDGAVATDPSAAQALMRDLFAEPDAARDNLRQAYDYLDRYALAPRIGAIGWCLGGGFALQTALMLPRELDALVMYYGQVVTESDRLATLEMPILGHFAALDQSIPVRDVQTFRTTLNRLGKNAEIIIYSDVDHAFANPSGGNYHPAKAAEAWAATKTFLATHLK